MGSFILQGRNRIIIGVVLTAWVIVAAIYTSRLQPTTTTEPFLSDDHPLQMASTILENEFPKTQEDLTTKIHFVWGLEEIDRKGVNLLLDPEFVGKANFDEKFTFDEKCQTALLDACTDLRTDDSNLEGYVLDNNFGLKSVDCFVEQLGSFNANNNDASCEILNTGTWKDGSWQVSSDNLQTTMNDLAAKTACATDAEGSTVLNYYSSSMGWDGTSMRYAGISVESTILDERNFLPEDLVREHYEQFIKVSKSLTAVDEACNSKVTMTDLDMKFIQMNNQRIYRTSAISGSIFGVLFAFLVLILSTRKLHISIFATLSILCVLIGVIGFITMIGWTLGTIEAILISIVAGFSVDYVIHLAHAYVHAEGGIEERVKTAFADMGISVFSGMLTSVVASIPLFFCTLVFFAKFGTFLCLTISLSWIFANFGFMSLLAQFKVPMDKKWL